MYRFHKDKTARFSLRFGPEFPKLRDIDIRQVDSWDGPYSQATFIIPCSFENVRLKLS